MLDLSLNDTEELAALKFMEKHKDCQLEIKYPLWKRILLALQGKPTHRPGPYPSHFSYIITRSGIGTGISIRCNYCGAMEDITDYDSW